MLYSKIYHSIIERAKTRVVDCYIEKHHIVPRCMGGTNDADNLVNLTFREHFICHQLLCKMYPENEKLVYAFSSMLRVSKTNSERYNVLTSRHFDLVKKTIRPLIGKWNIGRPSWNKGMDKEEYKSKYKNGGLTPPNHSGSRWINNGIETTKIQTGVPLPDGYVYGRLSMSGESNPMKNKETALKCRKVRKKK